MFSRVQYLINWKIGCLINSLAGQEQLNMSLAHYSYVPTLYMTCAMYNGTWARMETFICIHMPVDNSKHACIKITCTSLWM